MKNTNFDQKIFVPQIPNNMQYLPGDHNNEIRELRNIILSNASNLRSNLESVSKYLLFFLLFFIF